MKTAVSPRCLTNLIEKRLQFFCLFVDRVINAEEDAAKKALQTRPESFAKGQEEFVVDFYERLFVPHVDVFHEGKETAGVNEEILCQPIGSDRPEDRL